MNLITTTELRTKTTELVNNLLAGNEVEIVHRSRIIGTIKPNYDGKSFDSEKFIKLSKKLKLPRLTQKERKKGYIKHLLGKYGKDIS